MLATAAAIFSLLLIVTGVAKIIRPHDVAKALAAFGLPPMAIIGISIGVVEVGVGAGALFSPVLLGVQGALYAVFAAWVLMALRSNVPISSCGCLGRDDTPPTVSHIILNIVAFALSLGAMAGETLSIGSGPEGVAQAMVVLVGLFLSYVILTDAALLSGIRR